HVPSTSSFSPLSLHDALPICVHRDVALVRGRAADLLVDDDRADAEERDGLADAAADFDRPPIQGEADDLGAAGHRRGVPVAFRVDRKSTRLNSSHVSISYAVF